MLNLRIDWWRRTFPGEGLIFIYVKRINMQELTGPALDSFSFNTHSVGGVVIGGRSPKSIS